MVYYKVVIYIASIHRWGESLNKKELLQLGFYGGKICCYSSLTLILQKIDSNDLLQVMHKLLGDVGKPVHHVDGKFLKNSNCHGTKKYRQILTMFNNKTGATVNHQINRRKR